MIFGHQDDTSQPGVTVSATPVQQAPAANPLAVDPTTGASLPVAPVDQSDPTAVAEEPSVLNQPVDPVNPISDTEAMATSSPTAPFSADSTLTNQTEPVANNSQASTPENDDLLSLKQQALSQLSPLVGHLDQTPEEKFRTTMMMIQSTDDSALLKDAYEAAQAIDDEKARAQALLDVVNEINYFTQQQSSQAG